MKVSDGLPLLQRLMRQFFEFFIVDAKVSRTEKIADRSRTTLPMRTFLTILSTSLFYLGALNTHLARFVGTCNKGTADNLTGVLFTAMHQKRWTKPA